MAATRLMTLVNTRFLYVALILLALASVGAITILFPYGIYNLKCERFEMPGFESALGFKLGEMEAPSTSGGTYRGQPQRS